MALALWREADVFQHQGHWRYAFLTFFKILETHGEKPKDVIVRYLPSVRTPSGPLGFPGPPAILARSDEKVAQHLEERRRNPLAHASARVVLDPDEARHADLVGEDLGIVAALAEAVVRVHHGISPTPPEEWRPEWSLVEVDRRGPIVNLAGESS